MKPLMKKMPLAVYLLAPLVSQATATTWSSCLTVKSVSNQIASATPAIYVYVSVLSGCGVSGYPFVSFVVGTDGVTSANINSILASALSAAATGRGISVFYDSSTSSCYATSFDFGGNSASGYCP